MAQEKVHGSVKPSIGVDEQYHAQVACHCDYIYGQKHHKKEDLKLHAVGKSQEDELSNRRQVSLHDGWQGEMETLCQNRHAIKGKHLSSFSLCTDPPQIKLA